MVQRSRRRARLQLPARMRATVSPGLVSLPFHWGDLLAPSNAANALTIAAPDATSKQPELKFCAVSVEKVLSFSSKPKATASLAGAFGLPLNKSLPLPGLT